MYNSNFSKSLRISVFGIAIMLATFSLNSCKKETEQAQDIEQKYSISKSVKVFDKSKTYFIEVLLQTNNQQRINNFMANEPILDIVDPKELGMSLDLPQSKNDIEGNTDNVEISLTKTQKENQLEIVFTNNRNIPNGFAYGLIFKNNQTQNNSKINENCGPLNPEEGEMYTKRDDLATSCYTKNTTSCNAIFTYFRTGWWGTYSNSGYRTLCTNGGCDYPDYTFYASPSKSKGIKVNMLCYTGHSSYLKCYMYK